RAAIEGWPDNADIYLNLALALTSAGDTEGAIDALSAASALRPGDTTPYLLAGKLLLKQARPEDARKIYEEALAINPNDQDARKGLDLAIASRPAKPLGNNKRK